MSTIPTIFNERKICHTIIGGQIYNSDSTLEPFCVIVLNRSRRYYRASFFEKLVEAGFVSIISIETNEQAHDIETLSGKYPAIRFLFPREQVTIGEMINTALAETTAPYVLVLWSDTCIAQGSFTTHLLDKVKEHELLCMAPVLSDAHGEALLNQIVPTLQGNVFSTERFACIKDKTASIYPYDFMGIYNRKKCIQIGGFDYSIKNPYWQNLDFGFRAHLWGECIRICTSFRIQYEGAVSPEDISADSAYRQFYLKNLAPEVRNDYAYLSYHVFFPFMRKSGLNPLDALKYFSAAREWVKKNKYRFKTTAHSLIANWEPLI